MFWKTKIQISLELPGQIYKMSLFGNPLIKGFEMM